jgi:predicted component of type VI protein secretion system
MNMLIGILIACSIVSIVLIMVASPARAAQHMKKPLSSLDLNLLLPAALNPGAQRHPHGEADERFAVGGE